MDRVLPPLRGLTQGAHQRDARDDEDTTMRGRPSENELHRRIADLLMSPDAGRAVAGQLRAQGGEEVRRAALAQEGARRLDGLRRTIGAGRIATPERAADVPIHEAKQAEHAL